MRAEIVSIGTELLLGTITDTNASYLAQKLAGLGIDCYYVSQVGDNLKRIAEALERAWGRSDLVVTTGGLGPTQDDLTREAIAAMLGEEMRVDPDLERHLLALFTRRGINMPVSNVKQAALIPSATAIANPVGSAPGWWTSRRGEGEAGERVIISMPGVPYEMKRMWEREVEPRLRSLSSGVIVSRTLKVLGIGESRVEEVVADLLAGSNPTVAPYAKSDGVHLRITAKSRNKAEAEDAIAPVERELRARLGDAVYGIDDETPQGSVGALFEQLGLSFVLVEIGEGAVGALGPLLGAHPLCAGALGGRDAHVPALRDALSPVAGGEPVMRDVVESIRVGAGADVALALAVRLEALGDGVGAVKFGANILFSTGDTQPDGTAEAHYSWRATRMEVSRLAGLATLSHARARLLTRVREKGPVLAL